MSTALVARGAGGTGAVVDDELYALAVRRATQDDIPGIVDVIGTKKDEVERRFGQTACVFELLLERNPLSIVVTAHGTNDVKLFLSLSTCPSHDQYPAINPDSYENVLPRLYGEYTTVDADGEQIKRRPKFDPLSSLFVHCFAVDPEYEERALHAALVAAFATIYQCKSIYFTSLVDKVPEGHFGKIFGKEKVAHTSEGVGKAAPFMWRCPREEVIENLTIRRARVEDHDALAAVFEGQSFVTGKNFGVYYVAELIAEQDEDNMSLTCEREGVPVGMLSVSTSLAMGPLSRACQFGVYPNLLYVEDKAAEGGRRYLELGSRVDILEPPEPEPPLAEDLISDSEDEYGWESIADSAFAVRAHLRKFGLWAGGDEEGDDKDNDADKEDEDKGPSNTDLMMYKIQEQLMVGRGLRQARVAADAKPAAAAAGDDEKDGDGAAEERRTEVAESAEEKLRREKEAVEMLKVHDMEADVFNEYVYRDVQDRALLEAIDEQTKLEEESNKMTVSTLRERAEFAERTLADDANSTIMGIDQNKVKVNAFAISMYCVDPDFAAHVSGYEWLRAAFECFPDKEYCLLSLPHIASKELDALLLPFTMVERFVESAFEHVIYIAHRDVIFSDISVFPVTEDMLEPIQEFVGILDDKQGGSGCPDVQSALEEALLLTAVKGERPAIGNDAVLSAVYKDRQKIELV